MTTVLITGFHRSGTSAAARALHSSGLDLGSSLLGSEPSNPYGHFEDENCIAVHDRLLAAESLTWKSLVAPTEREDAKLAIDGYVTTRQRMASPPGTAWGVKDPRICLFLDTWLEVLPEAHVVFCLRPPGPTVASLLRRHVRRYVDTHGVDNSDLDFWRDPDLGLKLWCHYHSIALPALEQHPSRTVVCYTQPDQAETALRSVAQRCGLDRSRVEPLDQALGEDAVAMVDDVELIERAAALWRDLTSLINR